MARGREPPLDPVTWVLIFRGNLICMGSYWACIAEAEEQALLQRKFSRDGTTELAPRIPKGLILAPQAMIAAQL